MVTFVSDYSWCCAVYFLKYKSEVLEKFKEFKALVTNASSKEIGKLWTDNGGEYVSREFESYLSSKAICHELTVPYSPQQNGVTEDEPHFDGICPGHAFACRTETLATAAYLRNRTQTKAFKEAVTPFEKWYGPKTKVDHLRVFSCVTSRLRSLTLLDTA